jgi:general secretion pathway protein I
MIGLALLGLGLVVLVKSAANSIFSSQQAHMMGVATDLARAKMYDLEEKLIKDGFSDIEQHEEDQPFTEEGWSEVHYSYKIEPVELPSWDQLQELSKDHSEKSGSGSAGSGSAGSAGGLDSDKSNGFANSALGGMLSQFSGFGGGGGSGGKPGDIDAAGGNSFVQGQYQMFQQILKVSIRKVSLTLKWKVMGSDFDMKTVAFFTDPGSMDKVISGMGSTDLDGSGSGSGSGPGSQKK